MKKTLKRANLTINEAPAADEVTPPRLRVRRFSGDMLSGTDAENTLPQPNVEVTGVDQEVVPSHHEDNSSFSVMTEQPEQPIVVTPQQNLEPTEDEINRGVKIFNPFIKTKGAKSTFKVERIFNLMCLPAKLRHLYKCMGAKCSFTTTSLREFARHFDDHKEIFVLNPSDDPHKGFWNVCAYCLIPHAASKELCIHIRKEHGVCTMQCSKCFYRAKSIANVHFHHTVEHVGDDFFVLLCNQEEKNLPAQFERPFTDFVSAFRCNLKESCSLFTYMLDTFCKHLKVAHPNDLRCHLCMEAHPNLKSLLQHFCDRHGIGLYQCLFCTFGASSEHEIRLHLCYVHPNTDPKALQRTDNTLKQCTGIMNRESIKRLMFYKDQDKLMRFVNHPPPDEEPPANVSLVSSLSSQPEWSPQIESSKSTSLQTTATISSLISPKFNRPKIFGLSPSKSCSNETRVVLSQVLSDGGSSPLLITSDVPCSELSDTVTTSTSSQLDQDKFASADRDTSTPDSRISTSSNSNSIDNNSSNCEMGDTNYFKCGNKGCSFEASTSAPLKNHLVICDQARQSQKLSCAFCHRVFKQVGSFVEHLRAHGPKRYACSMCPFKASLASKVNSHMKANHHVFTTVVVPVDPSKQDSEKDYFVINCKEKRRVGEKLGPKGKAKADIKTKFSQEDLDDVPKAAIFQNPLGCRLCSYETKVRSNLIRHIQQHTLGDSVCQEEIVNPVPEKTEKMFDKMMNLAGSSHKKKPGTESVPEEATAVCMYKYVPDQDRYMCHVKECGYRNLSETMLRDHISVIHKDETYYVCPHCIEEVDVVPIPIDQLSMHLKLHDSPVYKCAYCHFCSHIKRSIERHTEVLHPGETVDVQAVRLSKPDHNLEQSAPKLHSMDKSDEQGEDWYCCNYCAFKTKKKKMMLQHGVIEHKMVKPFKCSTCGYESLFEHIIQDHFSTYHPDKDSQLIALYKMVKEIKKPVLPPIPPLWKRDAKRLKLIRGIKLDEKGDAPPPVVTATTGIEGLDVLELKFGHFGKPVGTNFMCPRCSTSFVCKNRQEMKEHLFKDLEYNPIQCKICKIGSTQRTKVMKHINKVHNIEWQRISECLDFSTNEELESWVEKVLERQQSLMIEISTTLSPEKPRPPKITALTTEEAEPPRKRRRSVEASGASALSAPEHEPPLSPPIPDLPTIIETSDNENLHLSQETIPSADSGDSDDPRGRERPKRDKCPSRHRFSCEHCNLTTKYKHSILLHCKKFHPDLQAQVNTIDRAIDDKAEAFNCMYCNCTALNLKNLKHHWTYTHKNSGLNFLFRKTLFYTDMEYECYWCQKRSDLDSLEEHCKEDHTVDQRFLIVSISVPRYKCSECNLLFRSADLLRRHFTMAHPNKQLCYIVVRKQLTASSSNNNLPPSSNLPDSSANSKSYRCFDCPYTSPRFCAVVKHMEGHFVTFVCNECENWFPSSMGLNSHMLSKHPSSTAQPHVLKGSEVDIENAKRNIFIISNSGEKRKITEEEIIEAEKEEKELEENKTVIYSFDGPIKVNLSPPKETARKSTGSSPKYHSTPPKVALSTSPEKLENSPRKALFRSRKKRLDLFNTFATVKSHNKVITLPVEVLRRIIDLDAETILETSEI